MARTPWARPAREDAERLVSSIAVHLRHGDVCVECKGRQRCRGVHDAIGDLEAALLNRDTRVGFDRMVDAEVAEAVAGAKAGGLMARLMRRVEGLRG